MKKSGLFFIFVCLFLITSCKNFLAGKDTLEQINNSIKYANAPTVTLNIRSDYGSVSNAGDNTLKVGDTLPLLYTEGNSGYQFIKWEVTPQNAVSFSVNNNKLSTQFTNEAEIKILKKVSKISIKPLLYIRPVFDSSKTEPVYNKKGVPKNSSIYLTCSQKLSEQNDVSKISIKDEDNQELYANKNANDNYFLPATISDNNIIISPNPNKFLDINGVEKITITIPSDFYYETSDGEKISFGTPYSYTYIVNSETVDKAEVNIGKDTGDILPNGLHNYSIGETFDIEYIISEGYYFNNWSVTTGNGYKGIEIFDSNSIITGIIQLVKYDSFGNEDNNAEKIDLFRFTDPVEDDANYLKKENKIKRTFTVLTNYSGILIKPNCIQLPDINDYEPKYSTSSENFDTPITITFNKKINTNLLDYDFINIKYGNTDCNSYFIKSFSIKDDVTVLSLKPTSSIKELFKNSNSVVDLTVTIDNKKITDTEGKSNTVNLSWQYRIKYEPEQEAPVLNLSDSKVYKDIEKKNELTNKAFESWSDESSDEQEYGDYSQNHINDKVYLDLSFSDNRSGVISVLVNETYLQNVDGGNFYQEINKQEKIIYFEYSEEIKIQKEFIKYQLASKEDGLIKLEFYIQDSSENFSEEKLEYYVIKDTQFLPLDSSNLDNISILSSESPTINEIENSLKTININIDDKWFAKDEKIFKTNINNKTDNVQIDNNTFIIKDDFENIFSIDIPQKCLLYFSNESHGIDDDKYSLKLEYTRFLEENYNTHKYYLYYFTDENDSKILEVDNTKNDLEINIKKNIDYHFYMLHYSETNNVIFSGTSKLLSLLSNEVLINIDNNNINKYNSDINVYYLEDKFSEIPTYSVERYYSGKFLGNDIDSLVISLSETFNKNYYFCIETNDKNINKNSLTLRLPGTYELFSSNSSIFVNLRYIDENGNLYKSKKIETIDIIDKNLNYLDKTSPSYNFTSPFQLNFNDNYFFLEIPSISDDKELSIDDNGNLNIEYWFNPCFEGYENLSESQLTALPNKKIYKANQTEIENGFTIPSPSFENGKYFLVTRFYDKAGNYHLKIDNTSNIVFLSKPFDILISEDRNNLTIKIEKENIEIEDYTLIAQDWFIGYNNFNINTNKWETNQSLELTKGSYPYNRTINLENNQKNSFLYINISFVNEYIHYLRTPQIIYTGNNTCTIKKLDYLTDNSVITNSDNAYLTMLITSPNNYGTENPTDWLKYGALVDTQQSSGIDYYKIPEDKIYNNEYYVIYCVYADGSVKITEPKFKE